MSLASPCQSDMKEDNKDAPELFKDDLGRTEEHGTEEKQASPACSGEDTDALNETVIKKIRTVFKGDEVARSSTASGNEG